MAGGEKAPGAPEGARRATGGAAGGDAADQGRFSSRRTMEAVLGVSGATLGDWRDRFLRSGQCGLKSRPEDDRDAEPRRLRAKVGELTMDIEARQELLKPRGVTGPCVPRRSSR